VLHGARQIAEADVDVLDAFVFGEFENVVWRLVGHSDTPLLGKPRRRGVSPFTHAMTLSAFGATVSLTVARTSGLS
jgi:hypothetical protein